MDSMPFPDSTAISSADYDLMTFTVTVHFRARGSYDYPCSPDLWAAFVASPSKGKFVNQHWVER